MQQGWLPLFPLQVVLLPGSQLPLHIFEERYKEMIGEALADSTEFGIVLANERGIAETGCTARIESVLKEYDDGRLDILTRGHRRFEIQMVNQDRNFLRGSVEYFDDEPAPADDFEVLRAEAIASYNRLQEVRSGDPIDPGNPDPQISFLLANPIDDLVLRQSMLMSRNETDRLRKLAEFLPTLTGQQHTIHKLREAARLNGHGPREVEDN